jgi:hypothetical protein
MNEFEQRVMVRDLNDRVYVLLKDLAAPHGEFDCECGDPACGRFVELTLQEYLTIRAQDGQAVLSPEHSRATGIPSGQSAST